MTKRILFVDDEPSILSGVERRLGQEYDLFTASSGEEGLERMIDNGPFAVIVSDMRMPSMNGIQFLNRARESAAHSVFIMLTGNQDQQTVVQALNEGEVFRFLNKPCENVDLKRAIDAGLRQYELVTGEKELLHKTFYGAVGVLTDVLEVSHPEIFSRSARIGDLVASLRKSLELDDRWEFKLAARLSLLGFALLPEEDRQRCQIGSLTDPEFGDGMRRAAEVGRRLIERIPRLENVARMIGDFPTVDGSLRQQTQGSDEAIVGATLIRVALEWDHLTLQGYSQSSALQELKLALPNLSPRLAEAALDLPLPPEEARSVSLAPKQLREGMVLAEDVVTQDGLMLLRKGRRLTITVIERLRCYQEGHQSLRPIRVVEITAQPNPELACV
ncbi:MAG: response regulator [Pirellulales bacterium]